MGTRADFYVGKGKNAEWIGSVAWDGYEWGNRIMDDDHDDITKSTQEEEYRQAVQRKLLERKDGTPKERGWPWPWEDSRTTDFSYCFVDGRVEAFNWGKGLDGETDQDIEWPDFSHVEHSAKAGSEQSGIMLFSFFN